MLFAEAVENVRAEGLTELRLSAHDVTELATEMLGVPGEISWVRGTAPVPTGSPVVASIVVEHSRVPIFLEG